MPKRSFDGFLVLNFIAASDIQLEILLFLEHRFVVVLDCTRGYPQLVLVHMIEVLWFALWVGSPHDEYLITSFFDRHQKGRQVELRYEFWHASVGAV